MCTSRAASERGAVLIQVMIATIALIAFITFVVDYGVMWVGRRQAQNAADAGAMAGAIALAFDDFSDRTDTGPAKTAARQLALTNNIWAEDAASAAANRTTLADITFPVCPDGTSSCIRVDVYRNQTHTNPLPMWIGPIIGLNQQGVRAMAIAQAAIGNASDCLKPWAIPDKWCDVHDVTAPVDPACTWTNDDTYETTTGNGANVTPLPDPDYYIAPTPDNDGGTGFKATPMSEGGDYGRQLTLKAGSPADSIAPGFFFPVRLPTYDGTSTGGSDYRYNIANCNGAGVSIGSEMDSEPGNMIGPTKQGVQDLIALDPGAYWDPATQTVQGSCAQSASPCAPKSPRIVAIPVYDTGVYYAGKINGLVTLRISNILGFFIDGMQGNDVRGYLVNAPGLLFGNAAIGEDSSFLKTVVMVR